MAYVHGHIRSGARARSTLQPDHAIQIRRRREDARADQAAKVEYFNQAARKTNWELQTEKKITANRVQAKFSQMKAADDYDLERRRQRLANLLREEQKEFEAEVQATYQTPDQRVAEMKNRAKMLKEQREAERKAFADEQLAKKWRQDCDALRHVNSRAMQAQTNAEREEQLRLKAQQRKEEEEENARYAEMWEMNRQQKLGREEADRKRSEALVKDQLRVLNQQVSIQKARKQDEIALKNEQRALLEEHWRVEAEEATRKARDRQAQMAQRRAELDFHNQQARARRQADMDRERELDLKVINEMIAAQEGEREQAAANKVALRAEVEAYRKHLVEAKKWEREQDAVVDRLRYAQQEEEWSKRQAQWDRENQARKRLMEEVYAERKNQLNAKLDKNRHARFEQQSERERVRKEIETNKLLDVQEREARKANARRHKGALMEQMEFKRVEKDREQDQLGREYQEFLRADAEYEAILKSELGKDVSLQTHNRRQTNFQYS